MSKVSVRPHYHKGFVDIEGESGRLTIIHTVNGELILNRDSAYILITKELLEPAMDILNLWKDTGSLRDSEGVGEQTEDKE